MINKKYIMFIRRLIDLTKENKIEWKYLDSNTHLCEEMAWCEKKSPITTIQDSLSGSFERAYYFDVENSFYTKIDETYIALVVQDNNPASLMIIPNTYKKVVTLYPSDYGENITRLLNIVQNEFPSGEAFVDCFLRENNKND